MGTNLQILASGVQDATGIPATSKVTANQRVATMAGMVSLATDILTFPGPSTVGNWLVPNQRVLIGGTPCISQSSSGQAVRVVPPLTPFPTVITLTDQRVSGS